MRNLGSILAQRLRQAEGSHFRDEEEAKLLRMREKLGLRPGERAPDAVEASREHMVDVLPEVLQNTPVLGVKQQPPVEKEFYGVRSGFEGKGVKEGSFMSELSAAFSSAYRKRWDVRELNAPQNPTQPPQPPQPPPQQLLSRAQQRQQQQAMGHYTRAIRQQGDARLRAVAAVTGAFVIATGIVVTFGAVTTVYTFKTMGVSNLKEFGEKMRGEVGPEVAARVRGAMETSPVLQLPGALGRSVADGVKRLVGRDPAVPRGPAPAPAPEPAASAPAPPPSPKA